MPCNVKRREYLNRLFFPAQPTRPTHAHNPYTGRALTARAHPHKLHTLRKRTPTRTLPLSLPTPEQATPPSPAIPPLRPPLRPPPLRARERPVAAFPARTLPPAGISSPTPQTPPPRAAASPRSFRPVCSQDRRGIGEPPACWRARELSRGIFVWSVVLVRWMMPDSWMQVALASCSVGRRYEAPCIRRRCCRRQGRRGRPVAAAVQVPGVPTRARRRRRGVLHR